MNKAKESGTEIGNSLGIRFRRLHLRTVSRAVKADEISVVEPTQPLRLARQSKIIGEARTFVPASLLYSQRFRAYSIKSYGSVLALSLRNSF